jgi:hypothetical protein
MRGILFSALLLTAAASHAQETSVSAQSAPQNVLMVFDAQGQPVGRLDTISLSQGAAQEGVFLHLGAATVFMPVRHKRVGANEYSMSQFEWNDSASNHYASADCSGSPLVPVNSSPRPVALIRNGADVTAYIAGSGYSGVVSNSSRSTSAGACETFTSSSPSFWSPQATFSLSQHFPEPLSIHY